MADQEPQFRRPQPSTPPKAAASRPSFDLSQFSFDPRRLKLSQAAIVGFAIGIFFHACVVFAVLDDGSGSNDASAGTGGTITATETMTAGDLATPTATAPLDREDCDAIRGSDYRSENERQWFMRNCTGS